jgi:hypothetical protein
MALICEQAVQVGRQAVQVIRQAGSTLCSDQAGRWLAALTRPWPSSVNKAVQVGRQAVQVIRQAGRQSCQEAIIDCCLQDVHIRESRPSMGLESTCKVSVGQLKCRTSIQHILYVQSFRLHCTEPVITLITLITLIAPSALTALCPVHAETPNPASNMQPTTLLHAPGYSTYCTSNPFAFIAANI